jgi:hypothetical protein
MSIWFLSENASDLSEPGKDFDQALVLETETAGTLDIPIIGQTTEVSYTYTAAGDIDDDHWANEDITVEINVTTANMNIDVRLQAQRRNAAGDLQEGSALSIETGLGSLGVVTIVIPGRAWLVGSSDDRLAIQYRFTNGSHGDQSVSIETGTTDTEVTANINLAGAARRIFVVS